MSRILPLAVPILFIFLAAVRIYGIHTREELHPDEIFSVMIAQHNPTYVTPLPKDTTLSGLELKKMLIADHPVGQDIADLYVNNWDLPHASLYEMALRLSLIGMKSFSAQETALRGGWLNMIFFTVAFIGMTAICRRLFGKDTKGQLVALTTLAIAFGCRMSVSDTLLVREYQMAEMFIVLLSLCFVDAFQFFLKEKKTPLRLWIWTTLCIAGALSTGYLNTFYIVMMLGGFSIAGFILRRPAMILRCAAVAVAGLLIAWGLYLGFFNFLIHPTVHTTRSFSRAADVPSLLFGKFLLTDGLTTIGALLLFAALVLVADSKRRRELIRPELMIWMPLVAIASMYLVEYTSVLREERYIYPYVSVAALLCGMVISALRPKLLKGGSVVMTLYMCVMLLVCPVRPTYGWKSIRDKLSKGAVMWKLNCNELPQIIPMTDDRMRYTLSSADSLQRDSVSPPVVGHKTAPPASELGKKTHLTGPLYHYE